MANESASTVAGGAVADLEVRGIAKRFGSVVAIERVDIDVQRGEFVAIMGPSGCGKTTLLRIIAGLERADAGTLLLRGADISDVPVHKRSTRLIWQDYSLFPFLNVRKNIEFGLTLKRHDKKAVRQKVETVAALVHLDHLLSRRIGALSGGEQQRVAIARALVTEPEILLLDEPLSSLDAHLRVKVQSELTVLQKELGISFIYVTHNQSEAFAMADRVVVMNKGVVEQAGRPAQIYNRPATHFVAEFVGANNIFEGRVSDSADGTVVVECGHGPVRIKGHRSEFDPGAAVELVVQADKLRRRHEGQDGQNTIRAVLRGREFTGSQVIYHLETAGGVAVKMVLQEPFTDGEGTEINTEMELCWAPGDTVILGHRDAGQP